MSLCTIICCKRNRLIFGTSSWLREFVCCKHNHLIFGMSLWLCVLQTQPFFGTSLWLCEFVCCKHNRLIFGTSFWVRVPPDFFFGGYVLHRFTKVWSTAQIFFFFFFFFFWTRVLGTNFHHLKLVCFELKIYQNGREMGLKNNWFFEKRKTKGIRTDIRCKKVGLWRSLKRGVVKTAHMIYPVLNFREFYMHKCM